MSAVPLTVAFATTHDGSSDEADTLSSEQLVLGTTTVATTALSIGYIVWLLRGGSLFASLMASLPAWSEFDPLPILDSYVPSDKQKMTTNVCRISSLSELHGEWRKAAGKSQGMCTFGDCRARVFAYRESPLDCLLVWAMIQCDRRPGCQVCNGTCNCSADFPCACLSAGPPGNMEFVQCRLRKCLIRALSISWAPLS